ncbi:MAG: hypothetical protein ABW007_27265 [Chitinophagaceae bacterium]
MNIKLRPAEGNTHYDTASQCLLVLHALWYVLSLAGREGVDHHSETDFNEALNVYGSLGLLFTNTLYAQVEEMESERRERERKGASDE